MSCYVDFCTRLNVGGKKVNIKSRLKTNYFFYCKQNYKIK